MDSITQRKRHPPNEITTKVQSLKLYRQTKDIGFVCRRYHMSKASLMRWNRLYDGTKESNPTGRAVHIQTPIWRKSWLGYGTFTVATPISVSVSHMASCGRRRFTADILSFYSYEDLQLQMKRYLRCSNRIPMGVLERNSPPEKRRKFEAAYNKRNHPISHH